MKLKPLLTVLQSDEASSLMEVAIMMPVLLMLLMGAVDMGRAYYLANEVAGAADAGAVYGSQNPTDTTGMMDAVKADAPDVSGIGGQASYGCECSDGSGQSASCSSPPSCSTTNLVYYVTVQATATYTPLFPWPGLPKTISMSNTAVMRSGDS